MANETTQNNKTQLALVNLKMQTIERDIGDIKVTLRDMNQKMDQNFISKDDLLARDERIKELEEAQKWIYRLVIGAVVLTALGLLFSDRIPM